MSERELRERIAMHGRSLFDRGLTAGVRAISVFDCLTAC